jgi:hypothetical protein
LIEFYELSLRLIEVSSVAEKRIYFNNNNKRGGAVSKIDGVIAEIESVLEKLGGVQTRLREIKDDAEAVEKARDSLRRPKPKKGGAH